VEVTTITFNMLNEAICNIKLKKVKEIHDCSAPKLTGFISEAEIKAYQSSVLASNFENWYDAIQGHTFPSAICPIPCNLMQLFVDVYPRVEKWLAERPGRAADWAEIQTKLTVEERDVLNSAAKKLRLVMELQMKGSDGVFVKTSSRSAKDAPIVKKEFKDIYLSLVNSIGSAAPSFNEKLICMLHAATQCLKMKNVQQVLTSFLLSERIWQDMRIALEHKDSVPEHFIVRQWVDLDCELEFRGFVYSGSLNALSQYNHIILSTKVLKHKDEYCSSILKFFNDELRDRLIQKGFTNYIIDFAITSDRIWVIELNPFLESTGGSHVSPFLSELLLIFFLLECHRCGLVQLEQR